MSKNFRLTTKSYWERRLRKTADGCFLRTLLYKLHKDHVYQTVSMLIQDHGKISIFVKTRCFYSLVRIKDNFDRSLKRSSQTNILKVNRHLFPPCFQKQAIFVTSGCWPGKHSLSENASTRKRKNLIPWEQFLSLSINLYWTSSVSMKH